MGLAHTNFVVKSRSYLPSAGHFPVIALVAAAFFFAVSLMVILGSIYFSQATEHYREPPAPRRDIEDFNAAIQAHKRSGSSIELRGADLTGIAPGEVDLSHAKLIDVNLSNANLDRAVFSNADVRGTRFNNATLRNACFSSANMERCIFVGADLTNADLSSSIGLVSSQLAAAILTNAKLPAEVAKFADLDYVVETAKQAQTVFLALLAACLYSWLTVATTTDAGLIANIASTPLPIIQTSIAIAGFYTLAPPILLAVYIYLHLYLQSMWEGLSRLPAIFPDGRALDNTGYPWLLSSLVSALTASHTLPRPSYTALRLLLAILTAWALVPFTIAVIWLRYLVRHDLFWMSEQSAFIGASAALAASFYLSAVRTLRNEPGTKINYIRFGGLGVLLLGVTSVGICISALACHGIYLERWNRNLSRPIDRIQLLAGIPPAPSLVGRLFDRLTIANAIEADISKRPPPNAIQPAPQNQVSQPGQPAQTSTCPPPAGALALDQKGPGAIGATLGNMDLRRMNARRAFLANADIREADLTDAILTQADLTGANLTRANISNGYLAGVRLTRAVLSSANLTAAQFNDGLGFVGGADLTDVRADRVNLNNADLFDASLVRADLFSANLDGANLSDADLQCARLTEATIRGANLSGAKHLTSDQLNGVCGDARTVLPAGMSVRYCSQQEERQREDQTKKQEQQKEADDLMMEARQFAVDNHVSADPQLMTVGRDLDGRVVRISFEPTRKSAFIVAAARLDAAKIRVEPLKVDLGAADRGRYMGNMYISDSRFLGMAEVISRVLLDIEALKVNNASETNGRDLPAAVIWFTSTQR